MTFQAECTDVSICEALESHGSEFTPSMVTHGLIKSHVQPTDHMKACRYIMVCHCSLLSKDLTQVSQYSGTGRGAYKRSPFMAEGGTFHWNQLVSTYGIPYFRHLSGVAEVSSIIIQDFPAYLSCPSERYL